MIPLRSFWLGVVVSSAVAAAMAPAAAHADARLSRSGNVVTLTSDGDGDTIHDAGTDSRNLISYFVERGRVLRAGPGCRRLRGPRVTRVVVTCGAPTRTSVNRVTLRVQLGGGDDTFFAAPWDDVQPRVIVDGGAGNDTVYGSTLGDDIHGGAGDDRLYGLDDEDALDGGPGNDLIVGGAGDDSVVGGDGQDRLYGDELGPTSAWGNDLLTAVDFGAGPDRLFCGEGPDGAVVDGDDVAASDCENLSGAQTTPPRDTVGTRPLTVVIGPPATTPGGLARILRGQPIRLPVTVSAAAQFKATLRLSATEARRLGVPARERTIADDIGTPLTLTPLTFNTQIRLRWPVRPYLAAAGLVRATLTIIGTDVTGARTVATRALTLRR